MVEGLFVTGTGTGVGKTVLAGAIAAALRADGRPVAVHKPMLTGLDEAPRPGWPPDHELLGDAVGVEPAIVAPLRFGPPISPHLAAELAGRPVRPPELVGAARAAGRGSFLVVEGVGGLLVPLTASFCVRDLAVALGLVVVVAASPDLGTINHTLLTLEAARTAGLTVGAIVLTPWPAAPSPAQRSNRETIARLGGVDVRGLPWISEGSPGALAHAAAALPLERWCAGAFRARAQRGWAA